ncbi:MAG: hypothetical protein WCB18_07685 [Thermoplasmata archaeon]
MPCMESDALKARPRRRYARRTVIIAALVVVGVAISGIVGYVAVSQFDSKGVIAFQEFGVPPGTNWSVTLETSGGTETTQYATTGAGSLESDSILFLEPGGQYDYSIGTLFGYNPNPSSGVVHAGGFTSYIGVHFALVTQISQVFLLGGVTGGLGVCDSNATWEANGCTPGQYAWDLETGVAPTVTYGSILLSVQTKNGTNYTVTGGPGGFSLMGRGYSGVRAEISSDMMGGHLWMSGSWTSYNGSASTPSVIPDGAVIRIDLGTVDPQGMGLVLVVRGAGVFSGSTSSIVLAP